VIRNAHAERWIGRETQLMQHIDAEAQRYAAARAHGDFDTAAVIAGEAVGLIHDLPPAAEIVQRVVSDAQALLARGSLGYQPRSNGG
jgi:nitronate monooxygenase